jgi:molybdopterin converting factor small subunit
VRRGRLLPALMVSVLLLAACGDDDETTEEPDEQPEEIEDAEELEEEAAPEPELGDVEPPEVELLDAGEEPLEPLRLRLEEGTAATSELTIVTGVTAQEVDGQQQPGQPPLSFVLTVTGEVTEIDGDEATVVIEYDEVALADADDVPEEIRGQIQQQFDALAEVSGTFTFDERSRVVDSSLDVPDSMDPQLGQTLQELEQELAALAYPFPEEDVGEGAVWQLTSEQNLGGIPSTQVTTVELVARDGDDYELAIELDAQSPEGEVELPGMPAGATASIEELNVSSTGAVVGVLTDPFPTTAEAAGGGTVAMVFSEGDETSTLRQELITEFFLERQ